MKIFGMGGIELVIILVVILLIFGPKNLPKLGNALGKTVSNLRSGMNEGKKKEGDEETAGEKPAEEQPEAAELPADQKLIDRVPHVGQGQRAHGVEFRIGQDHRSPPPE